MWPLNFRPNQILRFNFQTSYVELDSCTLWKELELKSQASNNQLRRPQICRRVNSMGRSIQTWSQGLEIKPLQYCEVEILNLLIPILVLWTEYMNCDLWSLKIEFLDLIFRGLEFKGLDSRKSTYMNTLFATSSSIYPTLFVTQWKVLTSNKLLLLLLMTHSYLGKPKGV